MSDRHQESDLRHGVPPLSVSNTSTLVNKTGSWKYIKPIYRDRVAPCNEGCPVGIDIEGYMNLLRQGRRQDALDLLLRENPMPAVTGRVCYHPCENACNRRQYDEAVGIRDVERMLGDLALAEPPTPKVDTRAGKVAIIGSGPAGLACAYHLARLGYAATVFEAAPEAGGILRLGIPDYRLPAAILQGEIDRIKKMGVEIRCGVKVGADLAWEELDGYDAVFLATGAHHSRQLGLDGEEAEGIQSGLSFLRRVSLGENPDVGRQVLVLGGGNTAMDCARTALRRGAQVEVLYRRTRAEMPAIDEEIEDAQREGIKLSFLVAPKGIRIENGKVTGLDCVRMRLGDPDASGRRRPVPVENSDFFVAGDMVLTAIGEVIDPASLPAAIKTDNGAVPVSPLGAATTRFFAGGDLVAQPRTVAHALGAGKRAALGIDHALRKAAGEDIAEVPVDDLRFGGLGNVSMTRWREDDPVVRHDSVNEVARFEDLNMDHFPRRPRHHGEQLAPDLCRQDFTEVLAGLPLDAAMAEAKRCFNCGVCNTCELCLIFCPDLAITLRADGEGFDINYDYCKGCGVCNAECPRGAMDMTREGL
jgi:2-oxoacid:acceptor oxidoreductase delta subunit (pyruvate/2-ketoisovalerate family)